ncbi:MAG: nucleotide exchange factor GrpE [Planctomycetaceae bacterium]|jgi:molecular chaperone GrpE (heat shock protein)|nr:nucleotide exchange factor GrpE [Planctomycetaceae bacterium]
MTDDFEKYQTSFDRLMKFSVDRESTKNVDEPITFYKDNSDNSTNDQIEQSAQLDNEQLELLDQLDQMNPFESVEPVEFVEPVESENSNNSVELHNTTTDEIYNETNSIRTAAEIKSSEIMISQDPIEHKITELSHQNANVLEQFTSWLYSAETENTKDNKDNNAVDSSNNDDSERISETGLFQVFEAITAQRQELKLYVKSGRKTVDLIEKSIEETSRAVEQLGRLKRERPEIERKAVKPFIMSLIEIDESLLRAISFLDTVQSRLIFHSRNIEIYAGAYCDRFSFFQRLWRRKTIFQYTDYLIKERAAEVEHVLQPLHDGFKMVIFRMDDVLRRHDVKRLNPVGELVNPETMQVVAVLDSDTVEAGHVVDVIRPGYLWRGIPFRFADVRAARVSKINK